MISVSVSQFHVYTYRRLIACLAWCLNSVLSKCNFREPSLETLPVIVSSGAAPARVGGAGATIVSGHADQIAVTSSILAAVAKTTRGVCCCTSHAFIATQVSGGAAISGVGGAGVISCGHADPIPHTTILALQAITTLSV